MAAVELSKPGSPFGPCIDEQCPHFACKEDRALASMKCTKCGKRIGYAVPFFQRANWTKLTHAVCEREGTD